MNCFQLTLEILQQILQVMNQREFNYLFNRIKIISLIAPKNTIILIQWKPLSKKYCFRVYYTYFYNPEVNISEIMKYAQTYQSQNQSSHQLSKIIQQIKEMNQFQIKLKELVNLAYKEIDMQPQSQDNRYLELFNYTISEEDFITKKKIQFPRIYFNNDQMNTHPSLIDQQTLFNDIIDNFTDLNKFQMKNELSKHETSLIQILWQMKLGLQELQKIKEINIEFFPQNRNFSFKNKFNGQPIFIDQNHYMEFIQRNRRFSQIEQNYLGKTIQMVELYFFEVKQPDIVDDDIFYIDIQNNLPHFQEIAKILQDQSYNFQQGFCPKQIEKICLKSMPYKLIHSTECQIQNTNEILEHYIEQYTCVKCKKQIVDMSSLYLDQNLYDAYQKLSDILNQQFYIDNPIVYLSKICIEINNQELKCYLPNINLELLNYSLRKSIQFEEQFDNQNKTSEEVDAEIDHYLYEAIQNDYE